MQRGALARVALGALVVVTTTTLAPALSGAASVPGNRPPGAPTLLTVDDAAAPLAVEGAPQFGWVVNDPDRGEVQTAYEVVVRELHDRRRGRPSSYGTAARCDRISSVRDADQRLRSIPTGRTRGRSARGITPGAVGPYRGTGALRRRASATRTGTPTGSAGPAPRRQLFQDFSLFRKQFTVTPSPIVRARAYMSAGQQFDLRVNGVRVAHGPSFSYPDEQYYEATDIARQLVAGHAQHRSA